MHTSSSLLLARSEKRATLHILPYQSNLPFHLQTLNMVSVKWQKARENPIGFFKVLSIASFHSIRIILSRILLPFRERQLSLRDELARMWIGNVFMFNPGLLYSEPAGHHVQCVRHEGFSGFLIPTTDPDELATNDAIILFAHGGGYIIGHALQYLDEYKRWVREASQLGKSLAILTVDYRKPGFCCSSWTIINQLQRCRLKPNGLCRKRPFFFNTSGFWVTASHRPKLCSLEILQEVLCRPFNLYLRFKVAYKLTLNR